mmetsp:Transcript_40745/g.88128  ORF Transcript_40745/g.88128 Transcript_40745/m.88128 type:complete len:271 (-) Transcript_40745:214-1026(-)
MAQGDQIFSSSNPRTVCPGRGKLVFEAKVVESAVEEGRGAVAVATDKLSKHLRSWHLVHVGHYHEVFRPHIDQTTQQRVAMEVLCHPCVLVVRQVVNHQMSYLVAKRRESLLFHGFPEKKWLLCELMCFRRFGDEEEVYVRSEGVESQLEHVKFVEEEKCVEHADVICSGSPPFLFEFAVLDVVVLVPVGRTTTKQHKTVHMLHFQFIAMLVLVRFQFGFLWRYLPRPLHLDHGLCVWSADDTIVLDDIDTEHVLSIHQPRDLDSHFGRR